MLETAEMTKILGRKKKLNPIDGNQVEEINRIYDYGKNSKGVLFI